MGTIALLIGAHKMLINAKNEIVNPPKEQNTKSHPHVFIPLKEILVTKNHKQGTMFRIEERAHLK